MNSIGASTQATGEFHLNSKNYLNVFGDASTSLTDNITSDFGAAEVIIQPSVLGTAQMLVGSDGTLEFKNSVAAGISVGLNGTTGSAALLKLDAPSTFKGLVNFTDGEIVLAGLGNATDYDLSNGVLSIYGGSGDQVLDTLRLADLSTEKAGLSLRVDANGEVIVTEQGTAAATGTLPGGVVSTLTQHVASVTAAMPPLPPPSVLRSLQAIIFDTTTNAYATDILSHPYMGPVAGIQLETVLITPDSLNITRISENMFIKTGAGNDAVALSGGTNVVDAGGGSNFLTSGTGFDTFFLDARNIPAASSAAGPVPGAIWNTIQNFGHGDATTFWGVGPGTALVWQKNEGAVGHTGLTLHANMPNGSEASLTLAGIDSKAGLSLSYGSSGGSSYLYVKAA